MGERKDTAREEVEAADLDEERESLVLKPAILFKEDLLQLFANEIYSEDYFFLMGYPHLNELPQIEAKQNSYQWAVIDPNCGRPVGWFDYQIDPLMDCVSQFWLKSFDRGNPSIILTVARQMEALIKRHHRVEWRGVEGNPVIRHYDKLCAKYHGNKYVLHDETKTPDGEYRDMYLYEIVKPRPISYSCGVDLGEKGGDRTVYTAINQEGR